LQHFVSYHPACSQTLVLATHTAESHGRPCTSLVEPMQEQKSGSGSGISPSKLFIFFPAANANSHALPHVNRVRHVRSAFEQSKVGQQQAAATGPERSTRSRGFPSFYSSIDVLGEGKLVESQPRRVLYTVNLYPNMYVRHPYMTRDLCRPEPWVPCTPASHCYFFFIFCRY
jgi:hypothetical protein